ncbi:MAG: regulatory protein GemA [Eikenella sp.]|nr:regulatory protein GemA [Eikenella sp.]
MRKNLNGLKAKIHIGKTQLGLDDDTYRALLLRETGKNSCAQMGLRELEKVLTAMGRQGFQPARPNLGRRPSPRGSADAMIRKVEALLLDNGLTWAYAHGMAKRMFGVDQVHWLPDDKLHKLVAALQIYANRKREVRHGSV